MSLSLAVQPTLDRAALRQVAALHRDNLPQGFLSSLGLGFLSCFYGGLRQYPGGVVVVCRDGERLVGFVTGVDDLPRFHGWLVRHKFLAGAWAALPSMLSVRAVRKVVELMFYPRKARQSFPDLPAAELVSLAVDAQYRRQGVASELYQALIAEFRKRGIARFRIMVGDSQAAAKVFYQRMGAKQVTTLEIHQTQTTYAFVHSLEPQAVSVAGE